MRLLLVEDDAALREILAKRLTQEGYAVDACGEGLEYALSAPYDGIVLDVMLPGVDGLTLLSNLRARGIAETRSISLHFSCEEPIELTADQSLITQLMLNLTENAVKYGRGGGDVWVHAQRQGGRAILTVADNGIGISRENLGHIFERFFRTGTGLGLSIAQWIVQLHGGTIRAESKPLVGTRFTVSLPID